MSSMQMPSRACCCAGLFDNALSDYFWARAVLLIGEEPL